MCSTAGNGFNLYKAASILTKWLGNCVAVAVSGVLGECNIRHASGDYWGLCCCLVTTNVVSGLWSWTLAVYLRRPGFKFKHASHWKKFLKHQSRIWSVSAYTPVEQEDKKGVKLTKGNWEESLSLAEGWLSQGAGICQFFLATEIQWNVWSQRAVFWEPDFMKFRLEQWKYINQCWHYSSCACLAYIDLCSV